MKVKETMRIGGVELKNRFVLAPLKTALNNPGGRVTAEAEAFYRRIAHGGTALLILEPAAVSPQGVEHPKQLRMHADEHIKELEKLIQSVHKGGSLAAIHLNHAGRAANPKVIGGSPLAPSVMTCPTTGAEATELSDGQIKQIIEDFGLAARRATIAGVDFIELQCGHGYLISQFYSLRTNRRNDKWGEPGKFVNEVLDRVMDAAGSTPVIARISGKEFVEGGLGPDNQSGLFALLGQKGVSALHVGFGNSCDSPAWYFGHMALPEEPQYEILREIRSLISIPVIAAGRMGYPERIEKVMDEGMADCIALGRPLIADPDFPNKMMKGQTDSILLCGSCLQACLRKVRSADPIACMANPWVTASPSQPTKYPKRVMVVGAGPAGIAAAVAASQRGHKVSVYEERDFIGGQFAFAVRPKGKTTMSRVLKGMQDRLKQSNVAVHMTQRVTAEFVLRESPDLLILATGARQKIPEIEKIETQYLMTAFDFFEQTKTVKGNRVLVLGAGMVGMEVAEMLLSMGKEVVACRRSDVIGSDMDPITRNLMMKRIADHPKLTLMPSTRLIAFTPKGVRATHKEKEVMLDPFNTVIVCSGMVPEDALTEALKEFKGERRIIGDAAAPATIEAAFEQGLAVGNGI
ncbi:MAG: FAD-dependent oxidoreductase [Deltaproteobacteria bacterium]|nr:FAD-dependent oxidoreductase [Deltaproteobacteria bacterium]